eukprot:1160940-Pelagomonas_calceolata.AAC.9
MLLELLSFLKLVVNRLARVLGCRPTPCNLRLEASKDGQQTAKSTLALLLLAVLKGLQGEKGLAVLLVAGTSC